ncbi:hypothetical protein BD324DRAFT_683656 [Kockovaella imperatae]|uniref:Uncharacterized protein n=1 Tax=Kockovaella imperatae TaxID=4999 RepID=A0A1Y1U872_9TREE|nr:hypothetical protein BD324DRAFT_683656 [Kockovaella imperatae]ORX34230.1 hypothetical protein BD324DRAFT_683656 [Kockovaella imperatae]
MALKRSPSPSYTPDSKDIFPSDDQPSSTPSPKKARSTSGSPKKSASNGAGGGNSSWNAEKSALFAEAIIAAGIEHVDREALANTLSPAVNTRTECRLQFPILGITKKQVGDQLAPNRSNIRKRLMEWAKSFGGSSSKP